MYNQMRSLTKHSVNEIFNPSRVDSTFSQPQSLRTATIQEDSSTNYGVVRLSLLERIYETLYLQRIRYGNSPEAETRWPHRILPHRCVEEVEESPVVKNGIRLHIRDQSPLYLSDDPVAQERHEVVDVDAVFVATGYHRDLHETLLKDARHLLPGGDLRDAKWEVRRDYRLHFADKKVSDDAGVWLQGCCESTHGVSLLIPLCNFRRKADNVCVRQLSDTLLSILATRGGQMVKSIFDNGSKSDAADGVSYGELRK